MGPTVEFGTSPPKYCMRETVLSMLGCVTPGRDGVTSSSQPGSLGRLRGPLLPLHSSDSGFPQPSFLEQQPGQLILPAGGHIFVAKGMWVTPSSLATERRNRQALWQKAQSLSGGQKTAEVLQFASSPPPSQLGPGSSSASWASEAGSPRDNAAAPHPA